MNHFVEHCANDLHYDLEEHPIMYLSQEKYKPVGSVWDIFYKIDMFGSPMNFYMNKKKKTISSACGGIMTIVFWLAALIVVY